MRAIPLPRNRVARWFFALVAYFALIAAGSALQGCATTIDYDGDGEITNADIALDFEDRYDTLRTLVRLGVALAEPDAEELERVNTLLAVADSQAAAIADDLRAGLTPGTPASNRKIARGLLTALADYLEAGERAAPED